MKLSEIKTQKEVAELLEKENGFYADTQDYPRQMDYALRVEMLADVGVKVEFETHVYFLNKFVNDETEEQNTGKVFKAFSESMKKEDFAKLINESSQLIRERIGFLDGESLDFSEQEKKRFKQLVKDKGSFSVAKIMLNFVAYEHYPDIVKMLDEAMKAVES